MERRGCDRCGRGEPNRTKTTLVMSLVGWRGSDGSGGWTEKERRRRPTDLVGGDDDDDERRNRNRDDDLIFANARSWAGERPTKVWVWEVGGMVEIA